VTNLDDIRTVYECAKDQRLPLGKLGEIKDSYESKITMNYFKDPDFPYYVEFELPIRS
jgi:hypothetical protein